MFKQVSIARKMGLVFGLFTLLVLGLLWFSVAQLSRVANVTESITGNMIPSIRYASRMQEALMSARRAEMRGIIAYQDKDDTELKNSFIAFDAAKAEFSLARDSYIQQPFSTQEEQTEYNAVKTGADQYFTAHQGLTDALQKQDPIQIKTQRAETKRLVDGASQHAIRLRIINAEVSDALTKTAEETYQHAKTISILVGLAITLLVVVVAWLLSRQIRQPLARLLEQTYKVSHGDLTSRLEMQRFHQDEFGTLAKGFNEMQENLRNLVSNVSGSVAQLSSSTHEISAVATQSSGNMHNQKDELNMLATAMNEMQATVQEIARNTNDTAKSAEDASDRADHGTGMVNTTIQSIEQVANVIESTADVITKLGADSHNIGMVLEVIGNIADQTNLLALNAAIEAARAGEQGRGFAVVADEVRTLARRTQESTSQIQNIISELQQRADQAIGAMDQSQSMMAKTVNQAREAGGAIAEISGAISVISSMMTQVATATEQQGAVSDELNHNIVKISQASDEVSAGSEEMARACAELNELATHLHGMVQQFRV